MPKYVFCDIDYTLIDDKMNITQKNYDAIKKFEAAGNHFILCSGRVPFALDKYRVALNAKEIVCANGAFIISDNKIIKENYLSKEILESIVRYVIENNIYARFFASDFLYIVNVPKDFSFAYLYKQHEVIDNDKLNSIIHTKRIIKVVFASDNSKTLIKAKEDITKLELNLEIQFSSPVFLELNGKDQNKGNGILDYCRYNNVKIEDTISIGDNENDLSMLKVTGFSACPKNGIDIVKQNVDYVCENDNNNSAVAEVLERIYF